MRDLDPAQPQRIAAVARFPCPFEPVAGQGNDKECCPRTSADIASGKHCSDADDGKGRPAEASHDAVCLPASGKVGEAVGTEDQEEGPLHQETNRRAERSAHKPDNGDREKDVAAPEKGGGEAGVSVQRPLDAVAWRSHRRRTRSAHARPLCPPRIHSSLFHADPAHRLSRWLSQPCLVATRGPEPCVSGLLPYPAGSSCILPYSVSPVVVSSPGLPCPFRFRECVTQL